MSDNEPAKVCDRVHCAGIVKEYTEEGPRKPPEELRVNNTVRKLWTLLSSIGLTTSPKPVSWHECSLCHRYQPQYDT